MKIIEADMKTRATFSTIRCITETILELITRVFSHFRYLLVLTLISYCRLLVTFTSEPFLNWSLAFSLTSDNLLFLTLISHCNWLLVTFTSLLIWRCDYFLIYFTISTPSNCDSLAICYRKPTILGGLKTLCFCNSRTLKKLSQNIPQQLPTLIIPT